MSTQFSGGFDQLQVRCDPPFGAEPFIESLQRNSCIHLESSMLDPNPTPVGTATADSGQVQATQSARATRWHRALVETFGEPFVRSLASPYVVREDQTFECPVAARFYRKDYAFVARNLFLEYQYRTWRGFNQEILQRYSDLLTKKLENIKILMQNYINRMQNLLDPQGHRLDTSMWPNAMVKDVPIISAHANEYLDALRLLEKVYLLAGTANMFGVLTSSQRAEAEAISKKAVRAFRSVLQAEVIKLYREAHRVMQEQRNAGTPLDPRLVEAVEQHGAAANAAVEDDEDGPAATGDEAAAMIDAAAAQSTAAGKAAKRQPAKRKPPEAGAGTEGAASPAGAEPVPSAAA
ncbi:hypothetical protein [Ramlibacter albus]|uniref:DUF1845 domain-containing protein n=1 Tax=Ramlibacter albus TaxID=2079448 RepID=A0A923MC03_9BURK|nr:hypothetical protein [Ramlibacter albus]MBC5767598.1 hypothetical protein [Ramlibacter albus]